MGENNNCFSTKKSGSNVFIYILLGSLLLVTVLQSAILVEIIKPIYKHCLQIQNSSVSNNSNRDIFYRVVICTLVFSISDFGWVITQSFKYNFTSEPLFLSAVLNLSLNSILLIFS